MKGSLAAVFCDDESGCTEWIVDYYEATASNWRSLMADWQFDPHDDSLPHLCPEHFAHLGKCPVCKQFVRPGDAIKSEAYGAYVHPQCYQFGSAKR